PQGLFAFRACNRTVRRACLLALGGDGAPPPTLVTPHPRRDPMKSDQDPQFDSLLPAARLSRRGFVTTLAAAGFALAVQPVQAQSVIRTDAEGLDTGEARIAVDGGELPVYFARPAGRDKMPVILVVQEIFGVHEYIRDV